MLRRKQKFGPIAIDIGTSSVRLLQLTEIAGQPALAAAAYGDLMDAPQEVDSREAAIRAIISEALRTKPFAGREIVSALSCADFQIKNLRLPKMPEEEMAGAVEFEAQDRLDLAGQSAQIRHLRAGEVRHGNEIKEEVIVFAAQDELVTKRLKFFESLRLRPIALDLTPCAAARSFVRFLRRSEDASAINVFIDVGWSRTSVIITHGTDIVFLKIIDIGGHQFTAAVAKSLNLDLSQAHQLRVQRMRAVGGRRTNDRSNVPEEINLAAADAIRPLAERLLKDIQLCLRYFAVTFRGQRPDSVTLVGGEASEPALLKIISDEIDEPCMVGDPLRGIGNLAAIGAADQRSFQPAWAVACGLALRSSVWVTPLATKAATASRAKDATPTIAANSPQPA